MPRLYVYAMVITEAAVHCHRQVLLNGVFCTILYWHATLSVKLRSTQNERPPSPSGVLGEKIIRHHRRKPTSSNNFESNIIPQSMFEAASHNTGRRK